MDMVALAGVVCQPAARQAHSLPFFNLVAQFVGFAKILRWGLWIVLIAGAFAIAPWGLPFSQTSIIRIILSGLAGLLGMFAILNLMYGTRLVAIINRIEKYLGKKIEQWLRNLTQ